MAFLVFLLTGLSVCGVFYLALRRFDRNFRNVDEAAFWEGEPEEITEDEV